MGGKEKEIKNREETSKNIPNSISRKYIYKLKYVLLYCNKNICPYKL